jgi:outer membrane protein
MLVPAAVLCLASCATNELALAPSTPDRPWVIPPSTDAISSDDASAEVTAALPAGSDRKTGKIGRGTDGLIDPSRRYDLAALIDLAQRSNPQTRVAWESARQAALAVGLSETSYVPQISAEIIGGYQRTPGPIPTIVVPSGYFVADSRELIPTLAAKWLLFDFGQRAAAGQEARANSFVANVAFTGVHQKVIFEVCRDYFALGAARGRLRVALQALKTAEVIQDAAEKKRANGLATVVELAEARRQTAQARFNMKRATGAEHSAYSALVASIGAGSGTRIRTIDSTEHRLPSAPSGDVDRIIRDALVNRPDIIEALGKIRAAEAKVRGANASYFPTIGMVAQIYENTGALSTDGGPYLPIHQPGGNILFKLSLPLVDGGARDANVAIARSEAAAARALLDQTRNTAVRQVSDAYDSLRTSFAEYSAAVPLIAAAETAYNAAFDAYRNGVGTYTDVINDEAAVNRARLEMEDAHANVFTAAAALALSTGAILPQR